jgi:hypothetical protein
MYGPSIPQRSPAPFKTFLQAVNDDRKKYDIVYDIQDNMDLQYHI